MKRKHVILAAAATVVVAAAIAPAIGITGNLTRSTRQASMVFAHFDRGANLMRGRHANGWHVEGWVAFLKADLKITDQQLPQWERFASALRENIGRMQELVTAHRGPKDAASAENRRRVRWSSSMGSRHSPRQACTRFRMSPRRSGRCTRC